MQTIEDDAETKLSKHALKRAQQRGIKRAQLELVLEHGDREEPVGGGCFRLSVSTRQLRALVRQGTVAAHLAERCVRLVLITDGTSIVTNYKQDL